MRLSSNLELPSNADWLEPPEHTLQAPTATDNALLVEMVEGFVLEFHAAGGSTSDTYCSALRIYLPWCADNGIDPLLITRRHASKFSAWLATTRSPSTHQIRSASRRAGILSACSSFLEYVIDNGARPEWARNPFTRLKRPTVDRSAASGMRLTVSTANQLVLGARADRLLGGVLGKLLLATQARMGIRPGDVCSLNLSGAADDGCGGYELRVPVKGGKSVTRWLPPDLASDFYTYLKLRSEPVEREKPDPRGPDPLFVHPVRHSRLSTDDLLRLLRRSAARAGILDPDALTCRMFRPFFNTLAKAQGAALEDRKVALGHARASTTERYDRTVWAREHDPAIAVAAAFDGYPAEARIAPLLDQQWAPPPVERGCDCTPRWPELFVDLSPVGVDQTAVAVITEEPEPGTHALTPYCRRCRTAYPGPFRVVRVLDDLGEVLLGQVRAELAEVALYPEAVRRRSERRRGAADW
ncbi:integrase [Kutzneria viridogrisea]|uniref:Integrase n=1 Tax=Kutzneria viridogrisea TaxID=47990 RepID=A0ABR6BRH9_9PSEU|nr:integrase [Kutzneria viridogrisea]